MKILARNDNVRFAVLPGDEVRLHHQTVDQFGRVHDDKVVLRHKITEEAFFDTALIVETEDGELGLKHGIGGIFGKRI